MSQMVEVSVGGLATADADGITLSQKVAGAYYLAINGALTDGGTANNVCQSQTPAGAGALTLNGTLASSAPTGSAVAYLGSMQRIYFTHAGDDSARTLTIVGQGISAAGYFAQSETLAGGSTSIVTSQKQYYSISSITISGSAAAAITVGRSGTGTLAQRRRIDITSGGNDTGITFYLVGYDGTNLQSEYVTGASGAAATSVLSYTSIVSVLASAAAATTVTVGSSAVADSQWVRFDDLAANAQTAVACDVTGTVNFDVETSMDDPNRRGSGTYNNPAGMLWSNAIDTSLVNKTADAVGVLTITPLWARVTLNSGTGTVRGNFRQAFYG